MCKIMDMPTEERIELLESKCNLKARDLERSFETMCNLSQGLIEKGYEQGLEQGFEQARDKMIEGMLRRGKTPKEISDFCDVSIKHVEKVQAPGKLCYPGCRKWACQNQLQIQPSAFP